MPPALPAAGLRQLARHRSPAPVAPLASPAPPEIEHCDVCADQLPEQHQHLLNIRQFDNTVQLNNTVQSSTGQLSPTQRQILCACQACGVLFDRRAAGNGLYRLIRPLRRPLPDLCCDDVLWAGLGVPVDLAFFVRHDSAPTPATATAQTAESVVTAHYPSPHGTVGAEVAPEAWRRLVDANPLLVDMDTEVVALLIRRERHGAGSSPRHASQQWLLGIDDCYQLTALLRRSWSGLTGGERVWREVDAYFDRLSGNAVG